MPRGTKVDVEQIWFLRLPATCIDQALSLVIVVSKSLNYITEKQRPIRRKHFMKRDCFLYGDYWSFIYSGTSDAQTRALL